MYSNVRNTLLRHVLFPVTMRLQQPTLYPLIFGFPVAPRALHHQQTLERLHNLQWLWNIAPVYKVLQGPFGELYHEIVNPILVRKELLKKGRKL